MTFWAENIYYLIYKSPPSSINGYSFIKKISLPPFLPYLMFTLIL